MLGERDDDGVVSLGRNGVRRGHHVLVTAHAVCASGVLLRDIVKCLLDPCAMCHARALSGSSETFNL